MNDITNCSDMIMNVINISSIQGKDLPDIWKKVVSKVKSFNEVENEEKRMPIGERLASNTRVVDLKNGVLLIETDHPGWIQYLKMYQKFIITGLKRELPDLKIFSMAYRVKGSDFCLSNNYEEQVEKSQKSMNEKYEREEKALEKYDDSSKKEDSKELPPELKEKFDELFKMMLTNDKN